MSRASIEASLARSRALYDWKAGDHDNPYLPGPEHDEYERMIERMHLREELGEVA